MSSGTATCSRGTTWTRLSGLSTPRLSSTYKWCYQEAHLCCALCQQVTTHAQTMSSSPPPCVELLQNATRCQKSGQQGQTTCQLSHFWRQAQSVKPSLPD